MDKDELDYLILQISKKDQGSFEILYNKLKTPVYGLAFAILKNREDAADVMQNTFIRIWQAAFQYKPGTDVLSWVLQITRNLSFYHLKKRKKSIELDDFEAIASPGDQVTETIDKLLLKGLLNALDESERQIVILYSLCGYKQKEISKIMGKPYATIRWKFNNAMGKLSNYVREVNGDA